MNPSRYAKALWALGSTIVGALILAVTAIPTHSLRDVGTLGWLTFAGFVLGVTGGVYGWSNTPAGTELIATLERTWPPSAGNPPIAPTRTNPTVPEKVHRTEKARHNT